MIRVVDDNTGEVIREFEDFESYNDYINKYGLPIDEHTEEV